MTNENKMTYVKAIECAINGEMTDEVVEKLNALKASIEKRNASRSGKPTKAQVANIEFGERIVAEIAEGEGYTCADIAKMFDVTTQKVAPIIKRLAENGKLTCEKVKGKNVYRLA